eukprot:15439595-Alexandrium_andersonii.AAC.1
MPALESPKSSAHRPAPPRARRIVHQQPSTRHDRRRSPARGGRRATRSQDRRSRTPSLLASAS